MDLYQKFTPTTALYPGVGTKNKDEVTYLSLGMLGELQEWYESGYDTKEAGDIFWYISQLCNVYNWNLRELYLEASFDDRYTKVNLPESIKKYLRDGKDPSNAIMNYIVMLIAAIKYRYSYSMNNPDLHETIASILLKNRDKLIDRQNRSVLHGDGDNR